METRFGYDFSQVKVHTDDKAAQSAKSVNALAYTLGDNVVFAGGKYDPRTNRGNRLLAHELTHVVQQSNLFPASHLNVQERDSSLEREARWATTQFAEGQRVNGLGPATAPTIQRQEAETTPSGGAEEESGFWGTLGGGLMGEFKENPSFAMIGVDVGVSLVPILDQVSDVRDVMAHLYYLIVHRQYDRFMRWLGLVFTLIGLIPELGSAIKGASKFIIRGVKVLLAHIADFVRPLLRLLPGAADLGRLQGFVARNWDRIVAVGMTAWNRTVELVSRYVSMVPAFVGGRLRALRQLWDRVVEMAPARLSQAFAWVRRKWDNVLEAVQRRLSPARAATPSTGASSAVDEELEQAFTRLERGEVPQEGALLQDLLHHGQRQEALAELRRARGIEMPGRPGKTPKGASINPQPGFQSAHTTPQSVLHRLPHYDPDEMITRILPTGRGHAHTLFDAFWQREFKEITERTGRTTTTAQELYEVIARAARESGAFSRAEAESVVGLAYDDLFRQLGLLPNQELRMPGT
jgi:hypothetical protein